MRAGRGPLRRSHSNLPPPACLFLLPDRLSSCQAHQLQHALNGNQSNPQTGGEARAKDKRSHGRKPDFCLRATASLPHSKATTATYLASREEPKMWVSCDNDSIPKVKALQINHTKNCHEALSELRAPILMSPLTCDCHKCYLKIQRGKPVKFLHQLARCLHFSSSFLLPWQPNATGKASPRLSVWREGAGFTSR